jgi:hypothetical protein
LLRPLDSSQHIVKVKHARSENLKLRNVLIFVDHIIDARRQFVGDVDIEVVPEFHLSPICLVGWQLVDGFTVL